MVDWFLDQIKIKTVSAIITVTLMMNKSSHDREFLFLLSKVTDDITEIRTTPVETILDKITQRVFSFVVMNRVINVTISSITTIKLDTVISIIA